MNQPDQLPALQDRGIEYATKAGYRLDEANFHRVFYAYCAGFTDGSSAERARADALAIQVRQADERGDDAMRRAHKAEARADALEAALKAALKHAKANGMQGWPVFVAMDRALLEKPHG